MTELYKTLLLYNHWTNLINFGTQHPLLKELNSFFKIMTIWFPKRRNVLLCCTQVCLLIGTVFSWALWSMGHLFSCLLGFPLDYAFSENLSMSKLKKTNLKISIININNLFLQKTILKNMHLLWTTTCLFLLRNKIAFRIFIIIA